MMEEREQIKKIIGEQYRLEQKIHSSAKKYFVVIGKYILRQYLSLQTYKDVKFLINQKEETEPFEIMVYAVKKDVKMELKPSCLDLGLQLIFHSVFDKEMVGKKKEIEIKGINKKNLQYLNELFSQSESIKTEIDEKFEELLKKQIQQQSQVVEELKKYVNVLHCFDMDIWK